MRRPSPCRPTTCNRSVVLTDGIENVPPMVNSIGGSITANTFAIGIGTANSISTDALNTLTQGTGGYLLVTGALTTGPGVPAQQVFPAGAGRHHERRRCRGPSGASRLRSDASHSLHGRSGRLRLRCDPDQSPLAVSSTSGLEAPDGSIIDPGAAAGIPAMAFVRRRYVSYYRTALPLGGPGKSIHAGKWTRVALA